MKFEKLDSLSIFFPVYNEEANIGLVLTDIIKNARSVAKKFEIIVVNDGSRDRTRDIVKTFMMKTPEIRLVSHSQNRGYGGAVKTGLKACRFEWVFFSDSDGQFKFDELKQFVANKDRADFVIGYRSKRRDPLVRIIVAQGLLKLWNRVMFGLKIKDVDCAYKLIPRRCLENISLITSSAITVTELMYRLIKKGYTYVEVPVQHYPRLYGEQTGNKVKVMYRAFKESLKLWVKLRMTG